MQATQYTSDLRNLQCIKYILCLNLYLIQMSKHSLENLQAFFKGTVSSQTVLQFPSFVNMNKAVSRELMALEKESPTSFHTYKTAKSCDVFIPDVLFPSQPTWASKS